MELHKLNSFTETAFHGKKGVVLTCPSSFQVEGNCLETQPSLGVCQVIKPLNWEECQLHSALKSRESHLLQERFPIPPLRVFLIYSCLHLSCIRRVREP
ncbi:hypothetical protein DJ530_11125 [Sulfolobus sp. E1]|nr:hypothetical protein DJ527_11460 [Sulfolobus sp. F1]TRM98324.1 hypothetical protein DJ530_11125 [Sulfolobus sp. E1]